MKRLVKLPLQRQWAWKNQQLSKLERNGNTWQSVFSFNTQKNRNMPHNALGGILVEMCIEFSVASKNGEFIEAFHRRIGP